MENLNKVIVDRVIYEEMINTLAQLPYADVGNLMNRALGSAKLVQPEEQEVSEEDVKDSA